MRDNSPKHVTAWGHAMSVLNRGTTLVKLKRFPEAELALTKAREDLVGRLREMPNHPRLYNTLAAVCNALSIVHHKRGQLERAEQIATEGIGQRRWLVSNYSTNPMYHSELGGNLHNLGTTLLARSDHVGARRKFEEAVKVQQKALEIAPKFDKAIRYMSNHCDALCHVSVLLGDHKALANWATALGPTPRGRPRERAAAYLCQSAALAKGDASLSGEERARRLVEYADRAMELLRGAVAGGLRDPSLLRTSGFRELSRREDFKRLLADLDK